MTVASDRADPPSVRIGDQVHRRLLNDATLEDQATTIDLLDIRVKTTADGYEISGSVPLNDGLTGGKILTGAPRDPLPKFTENRTVGRIPLRISG